MRPESSSAMAETHSSSRWRSWETMSTAPPKSATRRSSWSRRRMSRCASGSSSSSTSGRRARHAARATSFRCPPLSCAVGTDSASSSSPSSRRCISASPSTRSPPTSAQRASRRSWRPSARVIASRSSISAGSARRRSAAPSSASSSATSGRACRTVASAARPSPVTSWGMKAATRPRRRVTSPSSASWRPARIRSSVDLPPPSGPSTPIRAPAASSRSRPSSTRRPPNDFTIPRAERRGTEAIPPRVPTGAAPVKAGNPHPMPPVIHIAPHPRDDLVAAVREGGGEPGPLEGADGLVWLDGDPEELPPLPESVRWVQLPSAGVERWVAAGAIDGSRAFTSSTGAYGLPVAEHALALLLAGDRAIAASARARSWDAEGRERVRSLEGSTVAIVGAGGIGRALISMLAPIGAEVIAVTRRGHPVEGAARSLPTDRLAEGWPDARHVVLATPATAATRHLIGREELRAMREDAWVVNVARGSVVDTDALVEALREGWIAGAALDVTDPEPLPDGHPLWELPNALVTPHVATPPEAEARHFAARVRENVRRLAAGEQLEGLVDPEGGY